MTNYNKQRHRTIANYVKIIQNVAKFVNTQQQISTNKDPL